MQDGTKVRANAAADSFRRREKLEEHLERARVHCAELAQASENEESVVQMQARKRAAEGYVSQGNIVDTATAGVEFIGPVMQPEVKAAQCYGRTGVKPEFYADQFRFDADQNCFYCPEGMRLNYQGKTKSELVVIHKYQARSKDCAACASKANCCPKNEKTGRSVQRSEYHNEINQFQERMALPEVKQIYRQRSEVAETPHLWIKAKFGLRQFHVRGLVKVGMEALWSALTYNIVLLLRYRRQALRA